MLAAGLVVVMLAVLVVTDRVAVAVVQGRIAGRLQERGFTARPRVKIAGFPFLTQAAARSLDRVAVTALGRKRGLVEIKRLDVTLYGAWVSRGGRRGTAARYCGSVLVGFAGIAGMAGTPGLTLAAGGPGEMKITVGLGPATATATARVTRTGAGGVRIAVVSAGGVPVAMLGALRDFTLRLPGLPEGTVIRGVSVGGDGVLLSLSGDNVTFGG